jgi:hypothetical protein
MRNGAAALGVLIALAIAVGGCERSAEVSRAVLAQRRDSWSRELAGLREQHAALAARIDDRAGAARGPEVIRTRAVLEGSRQSIVDVENQLQQTETRLEEAIRRGDSAEKAIDQESALARGYLQGLGEQLGAAARQVDVLARN